MLAKLPAVDVPGPGVVAVVAAVPWVFRRFGLCMLKKLLAKLPAMDVVGLVIVVVVAAVPWLLGWLALCSKSNRVVPNCQQRVWLDLESADL